jgi:hypothetical protein
MAATVTIVEYLWGRKEQFERAGFLFPEAVRICTHNFDHLPFTVEWYDIVDTALGPQFVLAAKPEAEWRAILSAGTESFVTSISDMLDPDDE